MTQSKKRSAFLLLLAGCCAAVVASACTAGSSKGKNNASPTPTTLDHCQVVWASTGSSQGRYDLFVVDMPIADWTSGTKNYDISVPGSEHEAIFYNEYDANASPTPVYLSRGITTNGDFSVTVANGTTTGQSVGFVDSSGQLFWALDGQNNIGNMIGSNGTGNFTGVWSDPATGANPTPGVGVINITYEGTQESVNGPPNAFITYAVCYDAGGHFAPESSTERIETELRSHFHP